MRATACSWPCSIFAASLSADTSAINTLYCLSLPRCWCSILFVLGLHVAAPILFSIPEPSVYMAVVVGLASFCVLSCSSLALSFELLILISILGVHHGGRM